MIKNLIFDLDGTLYPESSGLEDECQQRVYDFFVAKLNISMDKAQQISENLLSKYHYEAQGVESELGLSQAEFLEYCCAVSTDNLAVNTELQELLVSLPQKKFIFTDSTTSHVNDVLTKLKVDRTLFDDIYDAEKGKFAYKLNPAAFNAFCDYYQIDPKEGMLFEDKEKNIVLAKSVGFKTVLINEQADKNTSADYYFSNINQALEFLKKEKLI
ncbi:MAG: HAD hydrolase-like protein [Alphaproteobacteria bacterium]|nr:HAD hydrolase-like protein [Alphaproteobacteria bacterium]